MPEGSRLDGQGHPGATGDGAVSGVRVGQGAHASSAGAVVQAGRDAVVTLEQHLHPRASVVWPVRAGIATLVLVAGGLASAGIVTAIRTGAFVQAVPAWTVPVAGVVVAALMLLLRRTPRKASGCQAFLVMSAFDQKYWAAGFVRRMHGVLERNDIDLVLKVPHRDYDAGAQAHHLRRILTRRRDYVGGFVVVTEVQRLWPDLVEFCSEVALPVVFTDVEPFTDESQYPDNAAFVGYVSRDLGTLAGRWLVTYLRRHGVRRPRVLIVASQEHRDRQVYCEEVLRAGLTAPSITVDDSCAFHRSRAYDAVQAHIRRLDPRQGRLDAVFCTNDEMALGAVDALRANDSQATANAVVVGVDGIPEARNLIDTGTSPLRATVVQDADRLTECAVHVLERMRDHREVEKRTILVPEVYQGK